MKQPWTNSKLVQVALVLVCSLYAGFLGGCPLYSNVVTQPFETLDFRGKTIGLLIFLPKKDIDFDEAILVGPAIAKVKNSYAYEGIWDPASTFEDRMIAVLRSNYNVTVNRVGERVGEDTYAQIAQTCESKYREADLRDNEHARNGGMGAPSLSEYLAAPPFEELRQCREKIGADLVCEVYLYPASYSRTSAIMNDTYYRMTAFARVVRLSDGKVLRFSRETYFVRPTKGFGLKSFRQLEENNLALLKQHYARAVEKVLSPKGTFVRELMKSG